MQLFHLPKISNPNWLLHDLRQRPLKELGCFFPHAWGRMSVLEICQSEMCLLGKCCGATDIDNPHLFVTVGRCFIQIVSESSRSVFLMSSFRKKINLLKTRLNETINLSSFTGCGASFCHQAFNAGASLDDDLQFLLGFLCSYGLPRACTRY